MDTQLRLTPDADAEELRATVRDFVGRHPQPIPDGPGGPGWPAPVWRRFAAELGAVGLDVPERLGGAGATFREVAVVAEELGRVVAHTPWFSTAVLGAGVLTDPACDPAAVAELLPALLTGDLTATLAHRSRDAALVATPAGDGWRVSGTTTLVVEGATADVLLVPATTPAGPAVLAVRGTADGVHRTALDTLDLRRGLARVSFTDAHATPVVPGGAAGPVLSRVHDRAVVALAAEQLGGAAAALEAAVAYAGQRLQFGRPIGSFQAIKHRCADLAVQVEAARSAVAWAAAVAAEEPAAEQSAELPLAAALAGMTCGEVYREVAAESIQVHGGIGFTWEHPAHLHLRRATSSAVLFGDTDHHRERLLATLGV